MDKSVDACAALFPFKNRKIGKYMMKKIILIIALVFITPAYAETLAQFEQALLSYSSKDFYEVKQEIESIVVQKIKQDPASFSYAFPILQEQYHLRIHFSPDKRLKFYSFDVGGGGTMGEYSVYVQTQQAGTTSLTPIDSGVVWYVKQTTLAKQPLYFVQSYYKGSSCVGAYAIHAFKPSKTGGMQAAKVFQTKSAKIDHIVVDFDCRNHQDAGEMPNYIRTDKALKYIDIMLLNQLYKPQNRYLRYGKTDTAYTYTGVVK